MSEPTTIAVSWPPLALGEAGWRRRLEAIAGEAEQLVGRPCTLQQTAAMALELFGLIWPAFGPETIAATARASLLLNMPVVMAADPASQLQEVAERLDDVWEAAQSDPAAGVVAAPAPLLQQVQKPQTRKRRSRSQVEPEAEPAPVEPLEPEPADPVALEAEPDESVETELPPPWSAEPEPEPEPAPLPERPARRLRPAHERMMRRPVPAVEPEPEPLPEPWQSSEPQPWPPLDAEPDPLPVVLTPDSAAPQPQPAPPTSWLTGGEVAELLTVTRSTVANHRRSGRMGTEGSGWIRHGRTTYFDPAVVEQLEQPQPPAGLDQLLAEVQAQ